MIDKIQKPKRLNIHHQQQKVVIKIVVVGYHSVGKTALTAQLTSKKIIPQQTLGVDYYDIHIDQKSTTYHLNFFDFSGRDAFLQIRNQFYRDSNILLLVFDTNYKRTYQQLQNFLSESKDYGFQGTRIVVANKIDQVRVIQEDVSRNWAKQHSCLYIQTSAVQNKGIQQLRNLIIKNAK